MLYRRPAFRYGLMILMIVAGWLCGHASIGKSTHRSQAPVSLSDRQIFIDIFGDSITTGTTIVDGKYTSARYPAPAVMQQVLRKKYPSIVVFNQGIGGTYFKQFINGTDGHTLSAGEHMRRTAAQISIEAFGVNDVGYVSTNEFISEVAYFVEQARINGRIPVIEEPTPTCNNWIYQEFDRRVRLEVQALNEYAEDNHVVVIPEYWYVKKMPRWKLMFVDCKHLTPEFYRIKGIHEARFIDPIVASLLAPY